MPGLDEAFHRTPKSWRCRASQSIDTYTALIATDSR